MKKIILASGSVQRKKLLQQVGLKFSVRTSNIPELDSITTTCSALVKKNALLKASHIAKTASQSVVIGADTVVYVGNKQLIGKPKNLKDARRILRILFSKPQWIYTGLAIIDTETGKTVTGYEKTRVFMRTLTEEEVRHYHKKVNPLDKAGGFDIEGWGSAFIHRIEGCYTNVIGLPVSKLAVMLKEVNVHIL
ncbi:MAG: septum formation protein Maf [Candidatus Omnitrophica bacterium]|nr:septum formation protein Maf [Candidatus Omnitrophota bacterium]